MSTLFEKLRAQREERVEVEPGKWLTLRRPLAAGMGVMRNLTPEQVVAHVTDWSGITEADLLGAAVGASDAAPFGPELVAEALLDRPLWMQAATRKLVEMVEAWLEKNRTIEKN